MNRVQMRGLMGLAVFVVATQAKAGITVNYISSPTKAIAAGSTGSAMAVCPTGSYAVGGGWQAGTGLFEYLSYGSTSSWIVGVRNTSQYPESLIVWAACASGNITSSNVVRKAITLAVPARQTKCADDYTGPICSSGVATAGGFWFQDTTYPSDLVYYQSSGYPYIVRYQNEWGTCFHNPSNVTRNVIVFTHCLNNVTAANVYWSLSDYVQIASGQSGMATANCYNGGYPTGAGFFNTVYGGNPDDYSNMRLSVNRPGYGTSSTVTANNNTTTSAWVRSYARCLNVP